MASTLEVRVNQLERLVESLKQVAEMQLTRITTLQARVTALETAYQNQLVAPVKMPDGLYQ